MAALDGEIAGLVAASQGACKAGVGSPANVYQLLQNESELENSP